MYIHNHYVNYKQKYTCTTTYAFKLNEKFPSM